MDIQCVLISAFSIALFNKVQNGAKTMRFGSILAPPGRFELPTFRLGGERCYPAELRRHMQDIPFLFGISYFFV